MRSVVKELSAFIKSDFHLWIYLYAFIILFVAIQFNYSNGFYWIYINIKVTGLERIFRFFLFFAIPWFMIAVPKLMVSKKQEQLKNIRFYIAILSIFLIMSIDSASILFKSLIKYAPTFDEQIYLTKILSNLQGPIILILFTLTIVLAFRNNKAPDLGFRLKGVNLKPFYILIIAIVPMILWASFNPEFTATYPGYKPWLFPELFKIPKIITVFFYEFLYGIDFIAIEYIFRGLLVILMARFIGRDAVLPMAIVYCFLHFGKPEVEAISSFFGGYLLGVIALYTRSIAPGVLLHLSLAYLMDIAAYIQHYAK